MENIEALAMGMVFKYIAGFIYLIGFVGIAIDEYTVFAIMSFVAILGIIVSLVFDMIFIVKTLKAKSQKT
jgi:hypothetical protein